MRYLVHLSLLRPLAFRLQVQFLRLKSALKKSGSSGSLESSSPTASLVKQQAPRHEAAQALAWVLHSNREACQVDEKAWSALLCGVGLPRSRSAQTPDIH